MGAAREALADGLDAEAVLLDVVGAVQRRVGAEWAANRLTVAQEFTDGEDRDTSTTRPRNRLVVSITSVLPSQRPRLLPSQASTGSGHLSFVPTGITRVPSISRAITT